MAQCFKKKNLKTAHVASQDEVLKKTVHAIARLKQFEHSKHPTRTRVVCAKLPEICVTACGVRKDESHHARLPRAVCGAVQLASSAVRHESNHGNTHSMHTQGSTEKPGRIDLARKEPRVTENSEFW